VLGLRDVQANGDPALAQAAETALAKLHARLPSAQAHRLKHAVLAVNRLFPPPAPGIDVAVRIGVRAIPRLLAIFRISSATTCADILRSCG